MKPNVKTILANIYKEMDEVSKIIPCKAPCARRIERIFMDVEKLSKLLQEQSQYHSPKKCYMLCLNNCPLILELFNEKNPELEEDVN